MNEHTDLYMLAYRLLQNICSLHMKHVRKGIYLTSLVVITSENHLCNKCHNPIYHMSVSYTHLDVYKRQVHIL